MSAEASDPPSDSAPTEQGPATSKVSKVASEKGQGKLARLEVSSTCVEFRRGPLPDPADLEAYNKIIPNGADRILKMAEAQSAHRIEIEKVVICSQQKQATRGQWFGLTIGLYGLSLGAYVGISGFPWLGASLGGATLVSLVVAFLKSKTEQAKDLSQKRAAVEPQHEDSERRRTPPESQR